jgi:hypothetical protein
VIVASARALAQRLSDPDRLAATGVILRPGLEIAPQDLGERLAIAGFSPEDPVDEHGEFCVRGGVVDLYPTNESQPVRLEFIGDIIESVRRYDAATQRSLTALDHVIISPQRELLGDRARRTIRPIGPLPSSITSAWGARVSCSRSTTSNHAAVHSRQWRASAIDTGRGRPFAVRTDSRHVGRPGTLARLGSPHQRAFCQGETPARMSPLFPARSTEAASTTGSRRFGRRDRGEVTVFVRDARSSRRPLASRRLRGARDVNASTIANAAVLVTIGRLEDFISRGRPPDLP